jgi:hypothetical protein
MWGFILTRSLCCGSFTGHHSHADVGSLRDLAGVSNGRWGRLNKPCSPGLVPPHPGEVLTGNMPYHTTGRSMVSEESRLPARGDFSQSGRHSYARCSRILVHPSVPRMVGDPRRA